MERNPVPVVWHPPAGYGSLAMTDVLRTALALREQWPALAKAYRHYAHQVHPRPGELWSWQDGTGMRIFNLLTQEGEFTQGAKPGKDKLAPFRCVHGH